jgi:hypothetical protein
MKLGKLLSAGPSFFLSRRTVYRLDTHFYLPKLNDGNPYMNKNDKPPAVIILPDDPKAKSAVLAQAAAANKLAAAKTAEAPATKPRLGWIGRLNPFRTTPPAAPAPAPRATQPEFSLSDVKVVHNDLADADVDVVSVGSRGSASAPAPKLPAGRRALDVLDDIIKAK